MHLMTLTDLLNHVTQNLPAVKELIFAFAYIAGFMMVFRGIHGLKVYGEMRTMMSNNANITGPLILLIVGACLIFTPSAIYTTLQTFYGTTHITAASEVVSWSKKNPWSTEGKQIAMDVGIILSIVGYIAFFRGLFLMSHIGNQGGQPGSFFKGIMFIVGGILLVNIFETWNILVNTLGF